MPTHVIYNGLKLSVSHSKLADVRWPFEYSTVRRPAAIMPFVPDLSITAIGIFSLFAAFRRFKDDDLQFDKAVLVGEVVEPQHGSQLQFGPTVLILATRTETFPLYS